MTTVVLSSLPYIADRETIKKTLEECRGNIDTAVSILLDAEDRASASSQQGSSSTERDQDSDDEFAGPNAKRIDRRMSRATKAKGKHTTETATPEVPTLSAIPAPKAEAYPTPQPTPPIVKLPVRILPPQYVAKAAVQKLKKEDEDGWRTQSDEEGDTDFQPDFDEPDDDTASVYSGTSRSQSKDPISTSAIPVPIPLRPVKTFQKQVGPQNKRITTRDRIDMKKAAQKAAQKEKRRAAAQGGAKGLGVTSINVKKNSPPLELGMGIKTLYI
jgi:OTU domain-containing protein 3